jgi:4-hydroxy-3-methylbut-2-enyl diphosphate reductase
MGSGMNKRYGGRCMEVILADYLGFCYGVKRAIKIARENASEDGTSCTLGPIIHNPQMVERLKAEGVGTVDRLDELPEGTIIIRSHGVGPEVYREAEERGLNVVDATCPHVKKAQLSAKELVDEGYNVVIIGEKQHPEVKSIFEWSGRKAVVLETEAEARELDSCARLGIVCQTTFSGAKFRQIALHLLEKSRDVRILRTICTATDQRQAAAIELAQRVDLMLVIGGKNSANTTRLAQLCNEYCLTYHIETGAELRDEWFDKIEKIGITAGASTPDWIIKEVYTKCQNRA